MARAQAVATRPSAQPKTVAVISARSRQPVPHIPPILLEGDPAPVSARKTRRETSPAPAAPIPPSAPANSLPETYGTGELRLTAREAHSLHAHWDLTPEQRRGLNASQRLGLRISQQPPQGQLVQHVELQPDARECFVPVAKAATAYVAELGHRSPGKSWIPLAESQTAVTPPDAPAPKTDVRFETIPVDSPLPTLAEQASAPRLKNGLLAKAVSSQPPSMWTEEQEQALAELIHRELERHERGGSIEIAELLHRGRHAEAPSVPTPGMSAEQDVPQPSAAVSSSQAPFGASGPHQNFRLSVNAELIISGATTPDATVTIGGQQVQLRPDGTFSIRVALPDGIFELPVVAVSADGREQRCAELGFSRTTLCHGQVQQHPLDPQLPPPPVDDFP